MAGIGLIAKVLLDAQGKAVQAGFKNIHLVLREALAYEFEGAVLNPFGVDIGLPLRIFECLKKLYMLERDRPTGKMCIRARVFGLMPLWGGPDFQR
jgi:hypothetical protein